MRISIPSVADVLTLPVAGLAAVLVTVAGWLNGTPDPKPFITEHQSHP